MMIHESCNQWSLSLKLVNLTPHTIHWYTPSNKIVPIEPSQPTLRLIEEEKSSQIIWNAVHDIQVIDIDYMVDLRTLPPYSDDALYIVSYMVAKACSWRRDFVYPYNMVRDTENRVIGCRSFGRVYIENRIPSHTG